MRSIEEIRNRLESLCEMKYEYQAANRNGTFDADIRGCDIAIQELEWVLGLE